MFRFLKPEDREIERQIARASRRAKMVTQYLDVSGGVHPVGLPNGFVLDRLRTEIGSGRAAFEVAVASFKAWMHFDLGWARVANALAPIETGRIIAVEVHSFGLWSLNLSQIVEVVRKQNRFGFIYKTTAHHIEDGEERFEVMLDSRSGSVQYETEAVSRPRDLMALLGYPVTRRFQHRFARESHRRMLDVVNGMELRGS